MLPSLPSLSGTRRRQKRLWPSYPPAPAPQRTPHRIVRHGSHDHGSFADDEKALPSPCTNHTFELLETWIALWYLLFMNFSLSNLKLKKGWFNPFLIFIHFAFSIVYLELFTWNFRVYLIQGCYSSANTDSATSIATESSSSCRITCSEWG